MRGESYGYLVWGVNNDSHEFMDTTFNYHRDVGHEPLEHYLARSITLDVNFRFEECKLDDKQVAVSLGASGTVLSDNVSGFLDHAAATACETLDLPD